MTTKRDKIGVNMPIYDSSGPCRFIDKVHDRMEYLGLNIIRCRAPQVVGADSWRLYKAMAAYGYRYIFTHRPGRDSLAEAADLVTFNALSPGSIIALEGPNEPDLNPVTFNGKTDKRLAARTDVKCAALALTQALRNAVRTHKELDYVKVIAFNDWLQAQQRPFTSCANSHIYPDGKNIASYMAEFEAKVKAQGNATAGVITEWGYHNQIGSHDAAAGISEAQAAANYAADIKTLVANPHVLYACIYNGVEYDPPTKEINRFGLFRPDWTAKPAADAVRAA